GSGRQGRRRPADPAGPAATTRAGSTWACRRLRNRRAYGSSMMPARVSHARANAMFPAVVDGRPSRIRDYLTNGLPDSSADRASQHRGSGLRGFSERRSPDNPRAASGAGLLPDVARSGFSAWSRSARNALTWDLGVTEGTRTPDLQGHNLGSVAD